MNKRTNEININFVFAFVISVCSNIDSFEIALNQNVCTAIGIIFVCTSIGVSVSISILKMTLRVLIFSHIFLVSISRLIWSKARNDDFAFEHTRKESAVYYPFWNRYVRSVRIRIHSFVFAWFGICCTKTIHTLFHFGIAHSTHAKEKSVWNIWVLSTFSRSHISLVCTFYSDIFHFFPIDF